MSHDYNVVGKRVTKVDGVKLVTGRPAFTDDIAVPGMLYGKILPSPHAHARIKRIDTSKARALPGVHAVLTYKDVPRVPHTTAGQAWPEPSPYDTYLLDSKVRFVGDRVAAVAAETRAQAEEALRLIEVEYEVLPLVLDMEHAMDAGAPMIHDEPDSTGIFDAQHNLAAYIHQEIGNVEQGFREADMIFEREYRTPRQQHCSIEPHVTITWLDSDNRLVIRSSTQVPYHARRQVAMILQIPVQRVHVIKPRIGGGFGGKQEMLLEDICGALTLATRRPVKIEFTREEEFYMSRSRHPQILRIKMGVMHDGTIVANHLKVLATTGAYGSHSSTVQGSTGSKVLPLYRTAHMKFECHVVYTNTPVAGAFRGYGCPQGFFAQESLVDEIAHELGMDPLEFRQRNFIQLGDIDDLAAQLGEGKLSDASKSFHGLEKFGSRGASLATSALADMAMYQGRFSEQVRLLEQGANTDLKAKAPEDAANKFAALAYAELMRGESRAAVAAAEKALANGQTLQVRFLAGRVFAEAGETAQAKKMADSLAKQTQPEPEAYGKIVEGKLALKQGDSRLAIKDITDANNLLDTWIGRFELGRAYLEAGQFPEADSEFDRCITRRGEAIELFMDNVVTYGYFPYVYYYQGRVRQGLKTPAFAESYRNYLSIRGQSGEDPLVSEIHRRLAQ